MSTSFNYFSEPGKDKILVTDYVPERFIEIFEQMHLEVFYYPELSMEALEDSIEQFNILVINSNIYLDKKIIDKGTRLKYVLRPGSGLDNVDQKYCEKKGIVVFNSPEANANAVAEHSIGLLLGLINYIPRSFEQVKKGLWIREENKGSELSGKTVGLVGYGNNGMAMAKKLKGFDVNILAYDKYKTGFGDDYVTESTLKKLKHNADIISLHIPLGKDTKYFINQDFINGVRKPFYLINSSRGKIVNTLDLIEGLNDNKILGAGLDVLENEKLKEYSLEDSNLLKALIETQKVIITPHIAGWTIEARQNIFYKVQEKFKNYIQENGYERKE